jgi:hypothetical protein
MPSPPPQMLGPLVSLVVGGWTVGFMVLPSDRRLHIAALVGALVVAAAVTPALTIGPTHRVLLAGSIVALGALEGPLTRARRRVLAGVGAFVAVLIAVSVASSFSENRSFVSVADQNVKYVEGFKRKDFGELQLQQLDRLRGAVDTLRAFDASPVPKWARIGLGDADSLYDRMRGAWLTAYRLTLHDSAWRAVETTLRGLSVEPGPVEAGRAYPALLAYLSVTGDSARAGPDRVASALLGAWTGGAAVDSAVVRLAARQFDTYARELERVTPWPVTRDEALVSRATCSASARAS